MKRLLALALTLILLTGCAPGVSPDDNAHILCTTYPVYLFTTAVTQGAGGVEVSLLVNQQTSCLHDYTLTVEDMKAIEQADIIVTNGAGLEDFLSDALAQEDVPVINCSDNVTLLPTLEHEEHSGHDHQEEYDPHYWMNPRRVEGAISAIADGLSAWDAANSRLYQQNEILAWDSLGALAQDANSAQIMTADVTGGHLSLTDLCSTTQLITFHDGFQYFADAFGLDLLKSIEEEEGAEASAKELEEIIRLVQDNHIPAIFVEKNGSRRSADVIAQETGCKVYELDLIMSGEDRGIKAYRDAMEQNLKTILEALG